MAQDPDYSDKRVLIVDDEEFMRTVVFRILKQANVKEILAASDGGDAAKVLAKDGKPVDCIISDFDMKPVNGLMLLKAIRSGKFGSIPRKQPFIMLTGHAESEVVTIAVKLDVSAYVVKPVPADKLLAALKRALDTVIAPKNSNAYASVPLGEAEQTMSEDSLPSAAAKSGAKSGTKAKGGVIWDRSKPKPKWLEDKLAAIRATVKVAPGDKTPAFKNVKKSWVKDLQPGMILAQDMEADGALLLPAGTKLSKDLTKDLKDIVKSTDTPPFIKVGELE